MDNWTLAAVERNHVLRVMRIVGSDLKNGADMLGINPEDLKSKLLQYRMAGCEIPSKRDE